MAVIHKVCGTELVSSGKGDFGHCPKCKKDIHHLVTSDGGKTPEISNEVIVTWD